MSVESHVLVSTSCKKLIQVDGLGVTTPLIRRMLPKSAASDGDSEEPQ